MSKCSYVKYLLISKNIGSLSWAVQKIHFWGSIWGVPRGWHPQTMSKYLSVKYLLISKKSRTLAWAIQKIDVLEGPFGGSPRRGWHPQTMSKYLSVKYLLISKRTSILAWAVQKIYFWGGPAGVAPKTFGEKKLRLQLNNFTQKLDFHVLWFRRRRAYKI